MQEPVVQIIEIGERSHSGVSSGAYRCAGDDGREYMKSAWHFATLCFQPYPDVGEFVNIGVLVVAAEARMMGFRLLPALADQRIRRFFPELDRNVYRQSRQTFEAELSRIAQSVNGKACDPGGQFQPSLPGQDTTSTQLFQSLTANGDGMYRIQAKGVRLAGDAAELLELLFRRLVDRQPVETDREEVRLEALIDGLLGTWQMRRSFKRDLQVGTESFHVRFPFAYLPEGQSVPERVIKPINLDRKHSTLIYQYGDAWIANLTRLRRLGCLPVHVFLPINYPIIGQGESHSTVAAAAEITAQLDALGVRTAAANDHASLQAFACIRADAQELVLAP